MQSQRLQFRERMPKTFRLFRPPLKIGVSVIGYETREVQRLTEAIALSGLQPVLPGYFEMLLWQLGALPL